MPSRKRSQPEKGPQVEWDNERTDIRLAVGRRVARAREVDATGALRTEPWSQKRLAERLNSVAGRQSFTQAFVSQLERGKTPVHLEYLVLLSEALDLPMLELVEPVLVREYGRPLLDLLVPFLTRAGKLSLADLEKVTAGARAEMANILLERRDLRLERLTQRSDSTSDTRFLQLVRELAQLTPEDWTYITDLALGIRARKQHAARRTTAAHARGKGGPTRKG